MKKASKTLALVLSLALALGIAPATSAAPAPPSFRVVEARLVTEVLDWGETITAIRIEYSEEILCDAIEYSVEHADRQTYQMASDRDIVNLYVNNSGKKDDYQPQGKYVFINLGLNSWDFTSYRDQVVFNTSQRIRPRPNPYYLYQAYPILTVNNNVIEPRGITTATSAIRGTLMDTSGLPNIEQMNIWSTELRKNIDGFRTFRYTNPTDRSVTKFHLYIPPGYEKKSADGPSIPLVVHFPAGDTAYIDDDLANADNSRQMGSLFTHPDAAIWGSEEAQAEHLAFVLTPGPNWNNNYMYIVKELVENLNIDIGRIYAISLAAGSTTMWNTILANPGVFAAQIGTAYDPYHAYAGGQGSYETRAKNAEDTFERILRELPGWFFAGLSDGSGSPVSGDPENRQKGDRWRDFGNLMNAKNDDDLKIDVGYGVNGELMWNGMLRGWKAEADATAQLDRANKSGAKHLITLFIPGTVLQTMHWSWNATYSNAVVRDWLYEQVNPNPAGTANIATPLPTYIITLDRNDGSITTSASTGTDGKLAELPTPTRIDYQFVGWFTEKTGGTEVTTEYVFTADTVIYAQWTRSVEPTPEPTIEPTPEPTIEPTPEPTIEPTIEPTPEPTPEPTLEPTPPGDASSPRGSPGGSGAASISPTGQSTPTPTPAGQAAPEDVVSEETEGAIETIEQTDIPGGGAAGIVTIGGKAYTMPEGFTAVPDASQPLGYAFVFESPFKDVQASDPDAWFYGDVAFVYLNGIFVGTSADEFSPNAPITRGQLITALGRLEGVDASQFGESPFTDVAAGEYYAPYVQWGSENGIVLGTGEGLFEPDRNITREEMFTIFMRYADFLGVELPQTRQVVQFADEDQIEAYAKEPLETMYRAGIVEGSGENNINPKGIATRAEAAAIIHRLAIRLNLGLLDPTM